MDYIRVEGLEVDCVVGLHAHERRGKQRVVVDLDLGLDLSEAGKTGRIAHTCDYDQVANLVRELLTFRRYQLIEAATEEMAAMLLGVYGMVEEVGIRIVKPSALPGRARCASVEITRNRSQYPRPTGTTAWNTLLETREAGLYLAQLTPGQILTSFVGDSDRQHAWLVAGELRRETQRVSTGQHLQLPASDPGYLATGGQSAVVLVCVCPPAEKSNDLQSPPVSHAGAV